jgi:amiloride-sensitive sodium channel
MQLNETDATNYCVPFGRIFKVIFHLPNEIPTPFHKPYYISYDHRRVITLTAKTIKTDDALREYPPDKRGCYFENERKLQFFNSYTKAHCDFECFANYTLNKCGCVKFSMPRTNDTPVCDLDNAHCYFYATNEWTEFDDEEDKKKTPCDCLPTCKLNGLNYDDTS